MKSMGAFSRPGTVSTVPLTIVGVPLGVVPQAIPYGAGVEVRVHGNDDAVFVLRAHQHRAGSHRMTAAVELDDGRVDFRLLPDRLRRRDVRRGGGFPLRGGETRLRRPGRHGVQNPAEVRRDQTPAIAWTMEYHGARLTERPYA